MGTVTHPESLIRVIQLAKFKLLLEGIFVKAASMFSVTKTTSQSGSDNITTYTIS